MQEPGEFNLVLPLLFGLTIFLFLLIVGLILGLLQRSQVIQITNKYYLLYVLRDAFLSLLGVLGLLAILSFALFILQIIYSFLSTLMKNSL
jgi:hypothetical protein